ncbi:MAG TPA: undecaprenyldiphospho-muramoylpentapeptide beta-N-acetylglucosaminyltransferase [Candidatus Handelsmanbacteria bacterium]|nr:undecaprenyldiphospho-muramoylpentapeptide beta-N-acetylglucosaminyltransferase [Candidatus Handelsmanbacteria bacterium]
MTQSPCIVLTGGGTGGHIMPALAVAGALQRIAPTAEIHYVGNVNSMEAEFAEAYGLPFHGLKLHPFMGKPILTRIRALAAIPPALFRARKILKKVHAQAAVAFGGYVCTAVGIMAPRTGVPLIVQEQNAVPGRTTRLLSKRASLVCTGMEQAAEFLTTKKILFTGNPIRPEINVVGRKPKPAFEPLRLLVMGGSQGAAFLNEQGPEVARTLSEHGRDLRVHHQVGRGDVHAVKAAYAQVGVEAKVESFIKDMASVYAENHIALARSGALSVSELWGSATPSVFVPFPFAVDDHQTLNAGAMALNGAAQVIQQSESTTEKLANAVLSLTQSQEQYNALRISLNESAPEDAASEIAQEILHLAGYTAQLESQGGVA